MKVKLDFKKKFLFARTKREGISIKKVNFISFSKNVLLFAFPTFKKYQQSKSCFQNM